MDSNVYRYSEILNLFLEKINSDEWSKGFRLPTERELAEEYGVSRGTVRKALDVLEQRGQVYRRQGRGTFVKNRPFDHRLSKSYSLREELSRRGVKCIVKILEYSHIRAAGEVCSKLELREEESVIKVKRLFYAENTPFAVDTTYLPLDMFGEISRAEIDKNGLYNTFYKHGITISRALETIRGICLSEDDAKLLRIAPGEMTMWKSRVAYNDQDRPIEYSDGVVRSDFFSYTVELR